MNKYLTKEQRIELIARHKLERDKRVADRIKTVLFLDDGYSRHKIANLLFLHVDTVCEYVKAFESTGRLEPDHKGSEKTLEDEETKELSDHLESKIYTKTKDIKHYIKETFKKDLSLSGIRLWLKRNDFTFKKPKIVPANTDPVEQQKFIDHYEKIMNEAAALGEPVLFGDSVHPCQETRVSYGWVKKGKDKEIPSTAGRKRINIMGALNLETMNFVYKEFETSIKSENAVEFLKKLEAAYPGKGRIHLIWDQAGYHKGNDVLEYLKTSRIKVHYLPPRSPNLNAIERLWKIMHEFACNNISFAKFSDFCASIRNFFDNTMHNIHDVLISRITDHFRIGFVGK